MMRIMIVESRTADQRKTLAAVRTLGKRGCQVWMGGGSRLQQAFYSRYCRRRVILPDPSEHLDGFVDSLVRFLKEQKCDVLLPLCDYTTFAASKHQDRIAPHVNLAVPPYQALLAGHDKVEALAAARRLGIGTPTTYLPQSMEEVREVAEKVDYPCVLKPRKGAGGLGLRYVRSPEELTESYGTGPWTQDVVHDFRWPMVQEYVPGEVHDACLLLNRGKAVAALTQKRIKMYPVSGGRGFVNETTDEPELRRSATKLLASLNWHGPAMVEFKMDPRDGVPKLMEINARFWGTLDLAIQAGVDFPYLTCKLALEGDVEPVSDYEVGLKYRWIVPYELIRALRSNDKLRSLLELLRFQGNTRYNVQFRDPLPHLASLLHPGVDLTYPIKHVR